MPHIIDLHICKDCHERDAEYGFELCEGCISDAEYQAACCRRCGDSVGCANLTPRGGFCASCRPRTAEEICDARAEAAE